MPAGFDLIVGRNALARYPDKRTVLVDLLSLLREGGRLSLVESIPRYGQRLSALVDLSSLDPIVTRKLEDAEESLYTNQDNPAVSWDKDSFADLLGKSGFTDSRIEEETLDQTRIIRSTDLRHWFDTESGYRKALQKVLGEDELEEIYRLYERELADSEVRWSRRLLFVNSRRPHTTGG
jgi:hypothetical protein